MPGPARAGKGGVPGSGEDSIIRGGPRLRNTVLTARVLVKDKLI